MDNVKIGAFIAQLRKAKNMTQKDLAEKLNITDKAVSKWERGMSLPDITILPDLSGILDITVTELLNGEKENNEEDSCSDNSNETVLAAIQYANGEVKKKTKNIKILCAVSITIAFIFGIIACSICDWAINNNFTWSLFPISSIVYAWFLVIPVTLMGKKGIVPSIVFLSILTIPFLLILDKLIKLNDLAVNDLIVPIGVKTSIVSIIYIWIVYFLFHIYRTKKFLAVSLTCLITVPATFLINLIVDYYTRKSIHDVWNIFNYLIFIVLAVVFEYINIKRKKKQ